MEYGVSGNLGTDLAERGKIDDALELNQKALKSSRLLTAIAVLNLNQSEILKAIPNSRKAEAFAHLLNDDSIKGNIYGNLGNALVDLEYFAKTPEFYELALNSFEKTNDLVNKSVTL